MSSKIGPGPITSATSWTVTSRMDRAGEFSFTMPASDGLSTYVLPSRIISIHALVGGNWLYVGGGAIDKVVKKPNVDGTVTMTVSGSDLMRELGYKTVVQQFNTVASTDILDALSTYVPAWTFTNADDPTVTISTPHLYISFAGESVLAAISKMATKLQTHFYLIGPRALQLQEQPTSSFVRAIQAHGDLTPETCAIIDLEETSDSYEVVSRIVPFGAGTGNARLTMTASTTVPPAGYTIDRANNWLRKDATEIIYGYREQRVEFKDIAPLSNTDADMEAAANSLYESAKAWLDLNTVPHKTYRLQVANCSTILKPLKTIRVVYRNENLDLNDDFIILESTASGDANGVYTTSLVVSSIARWPTNNASVLVDTIKQSQSFIAHPQLNANAYTTGYTKTVDDTYNATFRFRFGSEVSQINQVLFEFQILPLESTVKTIGGTASGSVDIPAHTHSVTVSSHTHNINFDSDATTHGFARVAYFDPTNGNLYYDQSGGGAAAATSSSGGGQTVTSASGGGSSGLTVDISSALTAEYGIFRESGGNTFAISDLEYSVNSGSWISLDTAITVDTGWYQLDITSLVQNTTNFRPLQPSNHLDIRKKAAAASKTANIDALLSVRTVIQAISYQ